MISRELLAMLLMAAILSSAAVSLLFHEKVTDPVEILRHDWNLPVDRERLVIPTQEGRYAHTLSLMVRRPIGELQLRFSVLENQSLTAADQSARPPREKIRSVPEVGALITSIDGIAKSSPLKIWERQTEAVCNGEAYSAVIVDLTGAIEALSPPNKTRSMATVHAFLFDEEGSLRQYYRGFTDFFLERETTLLDLTVQLNRNITRYAQRASATVGTLPLERAPEMGVLLFRDLKRDDRISIVVAIDPARVPRGPALLQVVSVYVDGSYYTDFTNLLHRSSGRRS